MSQEGNDFYLDNIVYRKFEPFFQLGKRVFDFANSCVDDLNHRRVDESLQSHLLDVFSGLYFSSLKTFCSVLFLCNKGHGEDAMSLTRTLFDNYLTLKYIQKDSRDRIYKFMNYPVLETKFMLDESKLPDCKMPSESRKRVLEKEREILENFNKIKDFYLANGEDEQKGLKKYKAGKWAGIDRRQMALDVGLEEDYNYVFHFHSFFVHPHPYGLSGFKEETESDVRFGAKPSEKEVFPALPMATRYLSLTLKEWAKTFELNKYKEIDSFLHQVIELENDYLEGQGFK